MCGPDAPGGNLCGKGGVGFALRHGVLHGRHSTADACCFTRLTEHAGDFRGPQFLTAASEEVEAFAFSLEVRSGRHAHVGMVAEEREQHGWGDGNLVRSRPVVVLHRILARHARHAVRPAHALQFTVGANELSELESPVGGLFGHDWIGPAEVVEPCHPVDVHAHADRVSYRFVHGSDNHGAGIDVRVAWHDAVADHQSAAGAVQGCDDGRIARAVALNANKGLDRRLSDDFVVVLPHPILLAGHVRPGKKSKQQGVVIGVLGGDKGGMLGWRPYAL